MAEGAVSQTRANPLNQFVTELYSDVRFENWVLLIGDLSITQQGKAFFGKIQYAKILLNTTGTLRLHF